MWIQTTLERERQDSISKLEEIRAKRNKEQQAKENEEWKQNQAEFLKKRVKDQEQRISDLEGLILQLASQLEKQSDDGWKLDWSKI